MSDCLVVFAREPGRPGVKTRLKKVLSTAKRRELYEAFLKDTAGIANKVNCPVKIVAFESQGKEPVYLKQVFKGFLRHRQKGRNLGARMHEAFCFAESSGASRMVIIGSDSPTLPPERIRQAFRRIKCSNVVLGPADDGGYYLIGLKSPCPEIFKGIQWGTGRVLAQTLRQAKSLKKEVCRLLPWHDVDTPGSLLELERELSKSKDKSLARWTRKFFKEERYDSRF
jgi:uncharacterized protein